VYFCLFCSPPLVKLRKNPSSGRWSHIFWSSFAPAEGLQWSLIYKDFFSRSLELYLFLFPFFSLVFDCILPRSPSAELYVRCHMALESETIRSRKCQFQHVFSPPPIKDTHILHSDTCPFSPLWSEVFSKSSSLSLVLISGENPRFLTPSFSPFPLSLSPQFSSFLVDPQPPFLDALFSFSSFYSPSPGQQLLP